MRNIAISTDVYAAIWAARESGENDENEILSRLLKVKPSPAGKKPAGAGVSDARNGVTFPEGFEIFRVYRNTQYRATAKNGEWVLMNNGQTYPTVNALSSALGAAENAWMSWRYKDPAGRILLINALRPKFHD
jgi:hypothetical protein